MVVNPASEISPDLRAIEAEIDRAFADNALARLPFALAAWTLLSVVEDHHFKITSYAPLEDRLASVYVDGLMSSLTYPMQVIHRESQRGAHALERRLIDEHYQLAQDWLHTAKSYLSFCAIFPLFHAKRIELRVEGQRLVPSGRSDEDLSYEVYNRFTAKRNPELEKEIDPGQMASLLRASMKVNGGRFSVHFTRRLMDSLRETFGERLGRRHSLPKEWRFDRFSLGEFRAVAVCVQLLAHGWFLARQLAAAEGAEGLAFASSVWTPGKSHLWEMVSRFSGINKAVVVDVLRYLTFGEMGVRSPDIAVQPLVDLSNGQYAVAPFVVMHTNVERNLCVLLNQIPAERSIYSRLVAQKEEQARNETIASLSKKRFEFKFGPIDGTDVDLAIIDLAAKACLCVELKWFIEPAEVREILERSKEIAKGVEQAGKITDAFLRREERLLQLLGIDERYDFLAIVASVNSIGSYQVQSPTVPVIKLWQLIAEVERGQHLRDAIQWLRDRRYLPQGHLYKIRDVDVQVGAWKSTWYGIEYSDTAPRTSGS